MKARILRRGEQEVVDARRRRLRPLHDHAGQHGRERRAAVDRARTCTSRSPSSSGSSTAYALVFAALLITGGKLADLFGRRKIFIVGLVVFTLSSLACGLAPNAGFLIGARAAAGHRRGADEPGDALDHHGDVPAEGSAARRSASGPASRRSRSRSARSSGGLIVDNIGWNWIFFVNVPVGAIGIVVSLVLHQGVARHLARAERRPSRPSHLGRRASSRSATR